MVFKFFLDVLRRGIALILMSTSQFKFWISCYVNRLIVVDGIYICLLQPFNTTQLMLIVCTHAVRYKVHEITNYYCIVRISVRCKQQ